MEPFTLDRKPWISTSKRLHKETRSSWVVSCPIEEHQPPAHLSKEEPNPTWRKGGNKPIFNKQKMRHTCEHGSTTGWTISSWHRAHAQSCSRSEDEGPWTTAQVEYDFWLRWPQPKRFLCTVCDIYSTHVIICMLTISNNNSFAVTFSTLFFFLLSLWFGDSTFDDSEADCPGFLRSESSCGLWYASKIQLCCWRNISAKHVQQIQQYIITYQQYIGQYIKNSGIPSWGMLPSWLPSKFIVPIGKIMVPIGFHHLPNHIGDGSNMSKPSNCPWHRNSSCIDLHPPKNGTYCRLWLVFGKSYLILYNMPFVEIPSGKHTKNYGKWPIEIDDLPIKNGDFL